MCNFFQVITPDDMPLDFIGIVEEIMNARPKIPERNQKIDEGFSRLTHWKIQQISPAERVASGCLLRIRADHSSRVARHDTDDIKDLNLPDGEFLTEFFCFCYFSKTQTIVVHRNWYAGGHTRLSDYINTMYGKDAVTFDPPLSSSGVERFRRMGEVYKAEVRLAVPSTNAPYETSGASVDDVAQIGSRVGAAEVFIRFSKARTKNPLFDEIKDVMSGFLERFGKDVKAAKVYGKPNSMAEEITVDLLTDRIAERVELPPSHEKPGIEDYVEALKVAYSRRVKEIEGLYRLR